MNEKTKARYVVDVEEGEFYRADDAGIYIDRASVRTNPETGELVVGTGDDGFGLTLDEASLQQFIGFLQDSMAKLRGKGST